MKFVHLADCHVGAWRDPKMKELTHDAFREAIEGTLLEQPDFVLIAGDLFNTALPGIDSLKVVIQGLQKLKEQQIPVYAIAGSHDFSPTGKTMLDVLEEAGFLIDVTRGEVVEDKLRLKWTVDPKTKTHITGLLGKRGQLDRSYYEDLDREFLEGTDAEKIFMFHTSISELKPKFLEKMDSYPVTFLPKNCRYYAGGHVHIIEDISLPGYQNVVYPGPVFPASFSELEKLQAGSYCVVNDWVMQRKQIKLKPVTTIEYNAHRKTPEEVQQALLTEVSNQLQDHLVLIRVSGMLDGSTTNIDFQRIVSLAYDNGAYFVMKNTNKLMSQESEEVVVTNEPDNIENSLLEQLEEKEFARSLMQVLCQEKQDGEKKYEYEKRVTESALQLLENTISSQQLN